MIKTGQKHQLTDRFIQENKHYSHVLKRGSEAEGWDKDNTYL